MKKKTVIVMTSVVSAVAGFFLMTVGVYRESQGLAITGFLVMAVSLVFLMTQLTSWYRRVAGEDEDPVSLGELARREIEERGSAGFYRAARCVGSATAEQILTTHLINKEGMNLASAEEVAQRLKVAFERAKTKGS